MDFSLILFKGDSMKGFYRVGGCVRDFILGLNPKDIDYVAVGYTVEEMYSLGFEKVGADFPVFLHPETRDEYALPRTERSTGDGYHDFEVNTEGVTLEEDLLRRDLTINAMALTPEGILIDPYGGQKDLLNKILRHTSEAFFEDPVRVLRIARFAARYDFTIAEETKALIREMRNAVEGMTKERIWKETEKALSEVAPHRYFTALRDLDVLDIVFPEIFNMIGVSQNSKYHAEGDVFNHTMLVLQEVSKITKNPVARFAALFHDIGKPIVFGKYGKHHGHESEEVVIPLLETVKNRYRVPTKFISMAMSVAVLHHRMYKSNEMKAQSILKTYDSKFFPKNEEDVNIFVDAVLGDCYGRVVGDGNLLSQEDVDLLFSPGVTSLIKGTKLFLPGKSIKGELVDRKQVVDLFLKLKAVSPRDFIANAEVKPSVEEIKQWIHLEKLKVVKSFR